MKLLASKNNLKDYLSQLESQLVVAKEKEEYDKVEFLDKNIVPLMNKLRKNIDRLELQVEKKIWPVPTYEDMLFRL